VQLDRQSLQRIVDWLDLNGQFYGDYSFNRLEDQPIDREAEKELRDFIAQRFGGDIARQPYAALVNKVLPEESRILKAPLAERAGGWGQITKGNFSSTRDPAYRELLDLIKATIRQPEHQDVAGTCGRENGCRCGCCYVRIDREAHQRRIAQFERLMRDAQRQQADRRQPVAPPDKPEPIPMANAKLLWVDSEESSNDHELARCAIDGDPGTYWHTEHRERQPGHPHELILDLGNVYRVAGFGYVPRGSNGDVKDWEFSAARSLIELEKPLCRGTFEQPRGREEERIMLDHPTEARYIRFRALSETHGNPYTSVAELILLQGR
jgi:hypothetical protein